MENTTVGFIGSGNIAAAIIGGALRSVYIKPENIYIYDTDPQKLEKMSTYGVSCASNACELVERCDYIFLTVKPQVYPSVLAEIAHVVTPDKILVSVAPGISIGKIKKAVGFDCKVIRTMPNTPLLVGSGAVAITYAAPVQKSEFDFVYGIFSASGVVELIDESHMDEIIAVNGSSPAYVFLLAKAVTDYADSVGIERDAALRLFAGTLTGSAKMLIESGKTPDRLISDVKSPNGTTEAALNSFEKDGLYDSLIGGMRECTRRAIELGQSE